MADYTVTEEDFATALDATALDEEIKTIIDDYFEDVGNDVVIETIDPSTGDIIDVTTEVVYVNATETASGNVQITIADITFFVDASSSLAALFLDDGGLTTTASGTDTTKVIIGTSLDDSLSISKTAANIDAGAGNDTVTTGAGADVITAGLGNDSVSSGAGNDNITLNGSEAGNDTVNAGSGYDGVIINENLNQYDTVVSSSGELVLTSTVTGATKTMSNVEYVSFLDGDGTQNSAIINTGSEVASSVARLYEAFGRFADKDGMEYWAGEVTNGNTDLEHLANSFLNTAEGVSIYGGLDNETFLSKAYETIYNRTMEDAGKDYWLAQMDAGVSNGQVLAAMTNSALGDDANIFNYINTIDDIV